MINNCINLVVTTEQNNHLPCNLSLISFNSSSLSLLHLCNAARFHSLDIISMSAVFPTPVSPSMTTGTLHLARSWMFNILTTKSDVRTYDDSSITVRRPFSLRGRPMAWAKILSSNSLWQSSLKSNIIKLNILLATGIINNSINIFHICIFYFSIENNIFNVWNSYAIISILTSQI